MTWSFGWGPPKADRTIEVVLLNTEQYGGDVWPPGNAREFAAWLNQMIDKAPEEYRDKVIIEISYDSYYDSTYATIKIFYYRPQTEEEFARVLLEYEADLKRDENEKRQQYEALKKRFDSSQS